MDLTNLPQPPTDNLYKFMAIFGLSIFIASFIVPLIWTYTLSMNVEETRAKFKLLEVEREIFFQDFILDISNRPATADDLQKFRDKTKDFIIRSTEIDNENNTGIKQLYFRILFGIYFLIAQIGGVFLINRGFKLWYHRLQKYQDVIVKNQAKGNT